ncbi:sensor histidine kinase [Roseomonas populi]|uniref:histidine kinase n=1 Tax=Roseomonas populi TaxID=3121582 RepID=A0ABT1X2L7_9PROT|nr:HAMP domain-containing sensor histidine kinase [Roseomonas pecuniae]MCR0982343.1 HAMP domain-containing histidine kinase [Roseomonas pecuniae]
MRSLTLRLALLTALWVAAGLAVTGWFVSDIAMRQIEAAADARISDLLDAVVAAAATDDAGRPRLERFRASAEFDRPLSGQYWRITGPGGTASSRSLWDADLPPPGPPDLSATRALDVPGPRGEHMRLLERSVELPGSPGPLTVQVAVARDATDADLARLHRGIGLAFAVLGLGLVAGVVAQVVWQLAPLRAVRRALAEVRAGTRDRLAVPAPAEVAPLVEEVDALIAQNQETLERARAHVGNLAHALKTPVAVILNALDRPAPNPEAALAQARALEGIVQHHLARARSAALSGAQSLAAHAAPLAVAKEVAGALRRLQADRGLSIAVSGDAGLRVGADRQDLIEIIGNVMENACKWAQARISVEIRAAGRDAAILVEDDGPGLPADGVAEAIARGVRLDETAPGSGLGLAIVADLAGLHGGRLILGRSERFGGTLARLELPLAPGRGSPGGR